MPKTAKKTDKKITKKEKGVSLNSDVYNIKGEKVGKIALPKEVFAVEVKPDLLAQSVRIYLENQRQGNRKAKTRGEVSGSTRKLFRQKGTGRARAGSIKSPIQVGGGIVHGPRVKTFHLDLPQKMRRLALLGALTQKYQEEKIKIINSIDKFPPKTKNMIQFINSLNSVEKEKSYKTRTLLVTDKVYNDVLLAGRNISNFTITQISQLNTYQVLQNRNLLILKNSLDYFLPKQENKSKTVKNTKKS